MRLASTRSSVPAIRVGTCLCTDLSINTRGGYEHRLWVCISFPPLLLCDARY